MVSSRASAIFERSRTTPMKMNSGTATRTSLIIGPNQRSARRPKLLNEKTPASQPSPANRSEVPARVKATGNPNIRIPDSEEHTSELQSLRRNSYHFFCLKKTNHFLQKKKNKY